MLSPVLYIKVNIDFNEMILINENANIYKIIPLSYDIFFFCFRRGTSTMNKKNHSLHFINSLKIIYEVGYFIV